MAFWTDTHTEARGFTAGFSKIVAQLNHTRAQRAEFNRVYDELSHMTDRELADIGISRVELGDVARNAARMV